MSNEGTRCATCGRAYAASADECPYCKANRIKAAKVLLSLVSVIVISGLFFVVMFGRCG